MTRISVIIPAYNESKLHLTRHVPVGRLATALEDAQLALFLASDKSAFIVGLAIPFSGGWTLQG